MGKVITVYSTKGQNTQKVETQANTWGELKKDLAVAGIDYSGMKVIVGETKTVLELDNAMLPKGLTVGGVVTDNCTIFLSPAKQKAGYKEIDTDSASYADLRAFIKNQRAKSEQNAEFFGDYTHSTTSDLKKLVKKFQTKNPQTGSSVKTSSGSCSTSCSSVGEVVGILNTAITKIKQLPGYVDNSESEALHQKAMEIEFELENVG